MSLIFIFLGRHLLLIWKHYYMNHILSIQHILRSERLGWRNTTIVLFCRTKWTYTFTFWNCNVITNEALQEKCTKWSNSNKLKVLAIHTQPKQACVQKREQGRLNTFSQISSFWEAAEDKQHIFLSSHFFIHNIGSFVLFFLICRCLGRHFLLTPKHYISIVQDWKILFFRTISEIFNIFSHFFF